MALSAKKVDVWAVDIPDAPGGLAARLAGLAEAGVNIEGVRRILELEAKVAQLTRALDQARQAAKAVSPRRGTKR